MFGYVAIVWNPSSHEQDAMATHMGNRVYGVGGRWREVFSAPGIKVYCKGTREKSPDAYPLRGRAGIVLGTIFRNPGPDDVRPPRASFGRTESARILESKGRELVDKYWGRYVAFIVDSQDRSVSVLRSPTGELDCLTTSWYGVSLFFSGTDDCPLTEPGDLSVDWDFIAADLATFLPETRYTGLKEIRRVLRGECVVQTSAGSFTRVYWHPRQFIDAEPIDDPETAARELRRVALACVGAWTRCHDDILALLSGGLDSSIVIGLISTLQGPSRVTCLNYWNSYEEVSDERRFARIVANRAGFPLIEQEQTVGFSPNSVFRWSGRNPQCQPVFSLPDDRWQSVRARVCGATAYFTGHGGDELFFQNGAHYLCADFIYSHGFRPKMLTIAMQAARMEGGAFWPELRRGIRDGLRRDPLHPVVGSYRFSPLVREDVTAAVREGRLFVPPWLEDPAGIPPGKCWQVIGLSQHDDMYGSFAEENDPECVAPLLSQPLQELCLRIPTYCLTLNGRSRGLARAAFTEDVPPEILKRRSKAFAADYLKCFVAENRRFLEALLLDGLLLKQGILDEKNLNQLLGGTVAPDAAAPIDLLHAVISEAWLQGWMSRRNQVAV